MPTYRKNKFSKILYSEIWTKTSMCKFLFFSEIPIFRDRILCVCIYKSVPSVESVKLMTIIVAKKGPNFGIKLSALSGLESNYDLYM